MNTEKKTKGVRWHALEDYWQYYFRNCPEDSDDISQYMREIQQQIMAEWLGTVNEECSCCQNRGLGDDGYCYGGWPNKTCECHKKKRR